MNLRRLAPLALGVCLSAGTAFAGTFSFTGTFSQDDQLAIFFFTAPSASTTVRTWSYAGGNNALGQAILAGGFDPVLSVFDTTSGMLLASSAQEGTNNDGAGVATDPTTGNAYDSLLLLTTLDPGATYALVLSQNDNLAGGTFGESYQHSGDPTFTSSFVCGGSMFCDILQNQRNGNWAVDITGVDSATFDQGGSVPEPSSVVLFGAGAAGLALLRRRRAQA